MNDPMMDMCSLVEKTPNANNLRGMISIAAERLIEIEVFDLTAA